MKIRKSVIKARNSRVHGKGVFATKKINKGDCVVEYIGKRMRWDSYVETDDGHTMLFHVTENEVIDATQGGNVARFINHSCEPNCQAVMQDERVYIEAKKDIEPGEELGYDYSLQMDGRLKKADALRYRCLCGSKKCRGTMLDLNKDQRKKVKRWIRKLQKAS